MSQWTYEEDQILLQAVETYTNNKGQPIWSRVGNKIGSRTGQDCRCRYRRILNGLQRRNSGQRGNKCLTCGQLRRGHSCPGKPPSLTRHARHARQLGQVNNDELKEPTRAEEFVFDETTVDVTLDFRDCEFHRFDFPDFL